MTGPLLAYSENPDLSAELLAALREPARKLGGTIATIHIGPMQPADIEAYAAGGADEIYHVDVHGLREAGPAVLAEAIFKVASETDSGLILLPATKTGREVAPRVAQRFQTGYASECVDPELTEDGLTVRRLVLGGAYEARLVLKKRPYILTLRIRRQKPDTPPTSPKIVKVEFEPTAPRLELVEVVKPEAERVELERAEVIVAVGRGFKKKEDIKIAEELAEVTGGELGCSRPISGDLKWLPEDRHIGLSGKRVRPNLYIAVGVSGQVQHLVGMRDSRTIIAINTDPNAPIMKEADYAIVGDLYKVLPALTASLRRLLGKQA